MTKQRRTIAAFAVIGALIGAALGFLLAPRSHLYEASANVALLPAPNLTTEQSSAFWEVLTRGQVPRTAAVLYNDERWLPSAANAAKVKRNEISVGAAALPDTTIVNIAVYSTSAAAAEAGLNDILNQATPDVAALAEPFAVKVLWPPKGNAVPLPGPRRSQFGAAAGLGGLLVGAGIGWFVVRSRGGRNGTRNTGGKGVPPRRGGAVIEGVRPGP